MGYRSAVGLTLTKAGVEELNKILQTVNEERRNAASNLLQCADIHYSDNRSGAELWYWEWLKWYPEYLDVSVFEELMDEVDYEDFRFIRIGEDEDDTENRGDFRENPFEMDLRRDIFMMKPR